MKQSPPPTDEVLVTLAQQGSDEAFSELTRRNYSSSLKLAHSILRDHHEAEDEVQNAFWKAYQHLQQFQRDARFMTWLTRIVVNQCLMRLRQKRRANFVFLDEPPVGDRRPLELPDVRQTPEQATSKDEIARVLHQEIRRIPPMLRGAFLLRDVEQLPMEQVAERLGVSVAAAKSRLLRARSELRDRMKKHTGRLGVPTPLPS